MKLKLVKRIGLVLQAALLISIGVLFEFERLHMLWLELILVAAMFGISMGMLFVSEKEDELRQPERRKAGS